MATLAQIELLIKTITGCPIAGLSGDPKLPAGIRIDFDQSAAPAQIAAAQAFLVGFNPATPDTDIPGFNQAFAEHAIAGDFTPIQYEQLKMLADISDIPTRNSLLIGIVKAATPAQQALLVQLAAQFGIPLPPLQ